MSKQQIADRWYEVEWPHSEGSDVGLVSSRYDGQYVQFGRRSPVKVSDCLANGYTFTPLVAMTAGRMAALKNLLHMAETSIIQSAYYPGELDTLRSMLTELEASDE